MPGDKERRDFGRRLSAMLLDKEMSMSDLARAVWGETRIDSRGYGAVVGKDRISSYCAGKTLPTALTARKLAKALACDVRDLLPNDAGDGGNEPVRVTLDRSDATRIRVEITRLREENARLREALAPLVDAGNFKVFISTASTEEECFVSINVKERDLRRARAAILGKVKDEAACPAPDEAP